MTELASRQVGRNGLIVMIALCRKVYDDGKLGRASAISISEFTGLDLRQVERGMADLKERGVIEPVRFKDDEGRWRYVSPGRLYQGRPHEAGLLRHRLRRFELVDPGTSVPSSGEGADALLGGEQPAHVERNELLT